MMRRNSKLPCTSTAKTCGGVFGFVRVVSAVSAHHETRCVGELTLISALVKRVVVFNSRQDVHQTRLVTAYKMLYLY
jgi:hypothetical protein